MSCLSHNKRYRSAFHSIINELRNENRMPLSIIRIMPKACCTCADETKETIIEHVMMKEENQSAKLKDLIERIQREKSTDTKLILSLNRFEHLIEQNRSLVPVPLKSVAVPKPQTGDSEDISPMEVSKSRFRYSPTQSKNKPVKPIKNGTFVFLPYRSEGKDTADIYLNMARTLQRNRFLARNGPVSVLEKQYAVRINVIAKKTSEAVNQALENAKKGLDKLTIHNKEKSLAVSEAQQGEWVLIRSKKPSNPTTTDNFDQVLDDLTSRWESCFTIGKRGIDDDEEEDSNLSIKKTRPLVDTSSSDSSSSSSSEYDEPILE